MTRDLLGIQAMTSCLSSKLFPLAILLLVLISPWAAHGDEGTVSLTTPKNLDANIVSQTATIPLSRLTAIMKNIRYAKEGLFSAKDELSVFDEDQVWMLSPKIQHALKRLHSGESVNYRIGKLKGQVFFNHGALYWHVEEINQRPARRIYRFNEDSASLDDESESQTNNKLEEDYWRLVPQPGQSLFRKRTDWIVTPVSLEPGYPNEQVVQKQEPKTARPPTHTHGSVRSRIAKVHGLLTHGLINREDHDEKIDALISEYEALHMSIKSRLEFLRSLRDNQYISDDAYAHGKKRLLDAL